MQSSVFFPFLAFEIIFETQHYIMKKLMFTLALSALVTMGVQAQKQMGGEHNVEVSFTPFSGSPIDGSTIKYRNFMDDDKAFRLSLTMSNSSDVHAYMQDGEISERRSCQPAIEHQHQVLQPSESLLVTKSTSTEWTTLSPYIAFECLSSLENDRRPQEFWYAGEVKDFWRRLVSPTIRRMDHVGNEQGFTRVGLNILFGADYYFSDAIYLGFEAGLGFSRTSLLVTTAITTDPT